MSIRLFNTLTFKRQLIDQCSGELKETITMQVYIPGVNSGSYDKALHVTISQRRPFKFFRWIKWKFGTEEKMHTSVTLSINEMIELRDELNKILSL